MEQSFKVQIECDEFIDNSLLEEFKSELNSVNSSLVINKRKKPEYRIDNFDGSTIPNIIITIITSDFMSSIASKAVYDVVIVKVLKLLSLLKKEVDVKERKGSLSIKVVSKIDEHTLDFNMNGDVSDKLASNLMAGLVEIVNGPKRKELFENEDLINRGDNNVQRIHMSHEQDSSDWNPLNRTQ